MHLRALVALVLAFAVTACSSKRHDLYAMLSPAEAAAVRAIPNEKTPEPLTHYWLSNEWRHELTFPEIAHLGGALVGVGSDQNYTLAAVADSEWIFVTDYDPDIRLVHELYEIFVDDSPTAAALVAHFEPENANKSRALIRAVARPADVQPLIALLEKQRPEFLKYLHRLLVREVNREPVTWLSNATYYAHTRELFRKGHVIARTADWTGAPAVQKVAAALRALHEPARIVYLSDAEEFFPYSPSFAANVESLPTDSKSVVLRTVRHLGLTKITSRGDWFYIVQDYADFIADLTTRHLPDLKALIAPMLNRPQKEGTTPGFVRLPRDWPTEQ